MWPGTTTSVTGATPVSLGLAGSERSPRGAGRGAEPRAPPRDGAPPLERPPGLPWPPEGRPPPGRPPPPPDLFAAMGRPELKPRLGPDERLPDGVDRSDAGLDCPPGLLPFIPPERSEDALKLAAGRSPWRMPWRVVWPSLAEGPPETRRSGPALPGLPWPEGTGVPRFAPRGAAGRGADCVGAGPVTDRTLPWAAAPVFPGKAAASPLFADDLPPLGSSEMEPAEPGLARLAGIDFDSRAPGDALWFVWVAPLFSLRSDFDGWVAGSSAGVVAGPRDFLAGAAFGFSLAMVDLPPGPERARVGWKGDLRGSEVNLLPLTRSGVTRAYVMAPGGRPPCGLTHHPHLARPAVSILLAHAPFGRAPWPSTSAVGASGLGLRSFGRQHLDSPYA